MPTVASFLDFGECLLLKVGGPEEIAPGKKPRVHRRLQVRPLQNIGPAKYGLGMAAHSLGSFKGNSRQETLNFTSQICMSVCKEISHQSIQGHIQIHTGATWRDAATGPW